MSANTRIYATRHVARCLLLINILYHLTLKFKNTDVFFSISAIINNMIALWKTLFYTPLYNSLVFLVDHVPNYSIFLSVIVLTIIVRFIIAPLSYKTIKTQLQTKKLQPKLNDIKKNITDKKEQAEKTLALYREYGVNPFSGILLMLIQLPIILALYWVFKDIGAGVDANTLYSFIQLPEYLNLNSFGFDLTQKSYVLAFLAGFTQYIFLAFSATMKKDPDDANKSESEKMMMMVGQSMKYTMPVMIAFFAYAIGGAVALYWITSNVFMIFQEMYIQKKLEKQKTA